MFKTLKSKILAIAITVFAVIIFVFLFFAYGFEIKTKPLILDYYSRHIEVLKDGINNEIIKIENNAKGLALIGNLFYRTDKSIDLTKEVVKKIFYNYPDSLGGGIWFEPYVIDKSQKRFCVYAFRNNEGVVVIDESFNSEEYNYLEQGWYKQIISQIKDKNVDVGWSLPYYENQGSNTLMITAGSGIYDNNGKLIGISTVDWQISSIEEDLKNMKFARENSLSSFASGKYIKNNFALLANLNDNYVIVSTDPYLDNKSLIGKSLDNVPWYKPSLIDDLFFTYQNTMYVPYVKKFNNGMGLVICIPRYEMFFSLAHSLRMMLISLVLEGLLITALLYLSLNRYVMKPINILTDIAHKISNGEDVNIKVEKPEEFAQLASTYDKMTKDIKTITNEKAKINSELSIAKAIQASSLPDTTAPITDRNEFDIYASMEPAKEVGGDFYDFFFIDEDKFMFLVADVSGKGVPAALFMMTVKTLINNLSQIECSPKKLIQTINKKICETNKQGFFVTMLAGIINIKTGEISIINCGHNLPLIKRQNEGFEYLQLESNLALGVFDNAEFEIYETVMKPGDTLYTYTDGVTEATNANNEMYGETRLCDCLNNIKETEPTAISHAVKTSIQEFAGSTLQSDDITMLTFKYNGDMGDIKTFKEMAIQENYTKFYTWLHKACQEWNINPDLMNKLDMCAEEIYANITFYAYPENTGIIETELKKSGDNIIFEFRDEGMEYNPLEKPDPDITLPPEQRPVGGLGIYMVKEMSDTISYKRENNRNILTMTFKIL